MSISTRVLRKFTENDLAQYPAEDESDVDDTPFSGGAKKKQLNVNRFDLVRQFYYSILMYITINS